MLKRKQDINSTKLIFLLKQTVFLFFDIKLCRFIEIAFFSYATKRASLTAKIGKMKFGIID